MSASALNLDCTRSSELRAIPPEADFFFVLADIRQLPEQREYAPLVIMLSPPASDGKGARGGVEYPCKARRRAYNRLELAVDELVILGGDRACRDHLEGAAAVDTDYLACGHTRTLYEICAEGVMTSPVAWKLRPAAASLNSLMPSICATCAGAAIIVLSS